VLDTLVYMRSLFTVRDNPFFSRALRRDLRSTTLVRNHAIVLVFLAAAAVGALALAAAIRRPMSIVGLSPGYVLAMAVTGLHGWIIISAVSYRARDSIDLENRMETLDLLRLTRLSRLQIMGMKATYPMLFGVAMVLPALPLYALVVWTGGLSLAEMAMVWAIYMATSVRPSGSSGAWYTAQLQPMDERKKKARQKGAAWVIYAQILAQSWGRLLPRMAKGHAITAALLPVSWVIVAAQASWRWRPFFGFEFPIWIAALLVIPAAWASAACAAHDRVAAEEGSRRLRTNPAWFIWTVGAVVVIAGFVWPHGITTGAFAPAVGGKAGDVDASLVALFAMLVWLWSVPVSFSLLFAGATETGVLPAGGPVSTDASTVTRVELLGAVGAVSVLAYPLVAQSLIWLLGWRLPAHAWWPSVGGAVWVAAVSLVYTYGLGRLSAVYGADEVWLGDKAPTRKRSTAFLAALGLFAVTGAGLFPSTGVPEWAFAVNPLSAYVGFSQHFRDWVVHSPWTTKVLPDWRMCAAVQLALGLLGTALAAVWARAKVSSRRLRTVEELPPPPPTYKLFLEGYGGQRWLKGALAVRLMRSRAVRSSAAAMYVVPALIGTSGLALALFAPDGLGSAMVDMGLVARGATPARVAFMGAFVISMGIVTGYVSLLAFAGMATRFKAECDQGTLGQLLLTPLRHREIALGYQTTSLYYAAVSAGMLLPVGAFGVLISGAWANAAVLLVVLGAFVVECLFSSAAGGAVGLLTVARPTAAGFLGAGWGMSRMAIVILVMVGVLGPLARHGAGRLMVEHPVFWAVLLAEAALAPVLAVLSINQVKVLREGDTPFLPGEEPAKTKRRNKERRRRGAAPA